MTFLEDIPSSPEKSTGTGYVDCFTSNIKRPTTGSKRARTPTEVLSQLAGFPNLRTQIPGKETIKLNELHRIL